MKNNRDELDKILDEGIAAYANAEPLANMEKRILERIRLNVHSDRHAHQWRGALVAGLAALFIASFVVLMLRPHAPNNTAVAIRATPPPAKSEAQPLVRKVAERRRLSARILRQAGTANPKQNSFPTPSPLTREEHLLQLLARTDPDRAAQAADNPGQSIQPIEISPITIAPLASTDGQ